MKKLFLAIRHSDLSAVKEIISTNPSLVNCVAKSPPKKDDGQSPLQVAIKSGNFVIANYLIDSGADVNWIEKESINEWKAPVVHDAIRAAVFSSRYPVSYGEVNPKDKFDQALMVLSKLIDFGAKMDSEDSYGNNCAMRVVLDARQLSNGFNSPELNDDLTKIFEKLKVAGLKYDVSTKTREAPMVKYKDDPVMKYLK